MFYHGASGGRRERASGGDVRERLEEDVRERLEETCDVGGPTLVLPWGVWRKM